MPKEAGIFLSKQNEDNKSLEKTRMYRLHFYSTYQAQNRQVTATSDQEVSQEASQDASQTQSLLGMSGGRFANVPLVQLD